MLGTRTAGIHAAPRRWIQRLVGDPSVHARQKWAALWPGLSRLPATGIRLLDAGCGRGQWALEIAARRPGWVVVGLDHDPEAVSQARLAASRLGLDGVQWHQADFFEFQSEMEFDVVLSVASAHYAALEGRGDELFRRFRSWLKPGGLLVLLAPRRKQDVPFTEALSRPVWQPVFSHEELMAYSQRHGFVVETLVPTVGRVGALAKQLDWAISKRVPALAAALRPIPLLLQICARAPLPTPATRSVFWSLVARGV